MVLNQDVMLVVHVVVLRLGVGYQWAAATQSSLCFTKAASLNANGLAARDISIAGHWISDRWSFRLSVVVIDIISQLSRRNKRQ